MTMRYWVVGGDYQDPDFRSLVPGHGEDGRAVRDERKARNEWMRLTYCPTSSSATTRYSIAAEAHAVSDVALAEAVIVSRGFRRSTARARC